MPKTIIAWIACFLFRLIPFRYGVEPLTMTIMPLSKRQHWITLFLFGATSMIVLDLVQGHYGVWSLYTAGLYGLMGVLAVWYFKNKKNKGINYLKFAVITTIIYDLLTGVIISSLMWGGNMSTALMLQIPWTVARLASNTFLVYFISPLIYKLLEEKKVLVSELVQ